MPDVTRRLLGWQSDEEDDPLNICPSLTYQQRIVGFSVCILVGFVLTFGSTLRIFKLLTGNPVPFVTFYSLGQLVSISASLFLKGPATQCKSMFSETRIVATLVYLVLLILTLIVSFVRIPMQGFVLLVLVIMQFSAFVWYSLSYIPYGRAYVKKICFNIGDEIV